MNTRTTHKIIAAGGMAAVIGVGVAVFFLRSTPVAPVARVEVPTAPVAEAPAAAPDAVAPLPAEPSPVAQAPAAAAVAAPSNPVSRKNSERPVPAVADTKPARERKSASATSPVDVTIARSETLATASDKPAASVTPDTVVASDTTPMTASAPTVSPDLGDSVKAVASDSQITAEVKSAIASEGLAKDASIGVTTTDGVVVLSGSVPSQAVVEQVKDVAAKVKDVKRVDISGLLASL